MATPHWHVLGAGAMGCLFASMLARAGCEVALILRRGNARPSLSVVIERQGQPTRLQHEFRAITPDASEHVSHLLVTTKSHDVLEAVSGVAHLLRPESVVLLLVNGLGLVEQLQQALPRLALYRGTTTAGAYRVSPGHIHQAGQGETRIGRPGEPLPPPWFGAWERAVENCRWEQDINTALWSKFAINCVINPLTAVHRCRNGELAERRALREQVERLCDEVAAVCAAAGFDDIASALPATVAAVIAGTAGNRSSMLQDIERGAQTEIDHLTGYLLQVAARHGIEAPLSRALMERIKDNAH